MSLLNNLTTKAGVEGEKDVLGGCVQINQKHSQTMLFWHTVLLRTDNG